mgnify:CR=1 FL=1
MKSRFALGSDMSTPLRIVIAKLSMEMCEIMNMRHEDARDLGHDYVISKAFQPPLQWIETAAAVASTRGKIVCMTRSSSQPFPTIRLPWTEPTAVPR